MTKLDEQAAELGFKIKKGPTKFSGYILINLTHDDLDEHPLGDDFRASLSDIEDYLESYAADIAAGRVKPSDNDDDEAEVETGANVPKVKPPSPQKLSASLRSHSDAAEIKALMKSAKVDVKPTLDIQFEQRALQSRQSFNPNWNDIGGHEYNEHDEADGGRDLKQYLEEEKRKRESFEKYLAPDMGTPDFNTPKAATAFVVTSKKCRVKKADITPKARTLLTIETAIRVAQSKGDKAGVGKLLLEAKTNTLDHGEFMKWAERATGLTSRSCRDYMAMADQNGKLK